jgi:uncharacterized protein (TIGR03435 family)
MTKRCLGLVTTAVLGVALASAQQPAQPASGNEAAHEAQLPKLTFDVISVKQNHKAAQDENMGMNADGFEATNVSVHTLLGQGWRAFDDELINVPKWAENDRWDIVAKISGEDMKAFGKLTFDQRLQMFQEVLEQRFGLKAHRETRVLAVYALVVAKSGVKMTPWKRGPNDPPIMEGSPGNLNGGKGKETGRGALVQFLAEDLSDEVGRRVVDQTGLTGRYDFTLKWTPDNGAAANSGSNAGAESGPSLFTALEEQLGLKLVPVKAPVDVVVVDHLDRPTEN